MRTIPRPTHTYSTDSTTETRTRIRPGQPPRVCAFRRFSFGNHDARAASEPSFVRILRRALVRLRRASALFLPGLLLLVLSGCQNQQPPTPTKTQPTGAALDFDALLATDRSETQYAGVLPQFSDVAADRGLIFQMHSDEDVGEMNMPEVFGAGIAALDYDLDGWCDVMLPNGRAFPLDQVSTQHTDRLFRNRGGHFQSVAAEAGIEGYDYSHGCAYGDLNLDGFPDLLVANIGVCELYFNQGDGTFLKQKVPFFEQNQQWWIAPLIVDLDADQVPDIFLVPYVDWYVDAPLSKQPNGPGYPGPNEFDTLPTGSLRNLGDGTWQDSSELWGLKLESKGLAAVAVDLDLDLKPEIYVANDSEANFLLTTSRGMEFDDRLTNSSRLVASMNDGPDLTSKTLWLDVGEISGTGGGIQGQDEASMCATTWDFDRNGLPDLLVSNYYARNNSNYANRGDLNFRNVTYASRMDTIGKPFNSFGMSAVDFDLDGNWDVVVANGHVLGPNYYAYQMTQQLLRNIDGSFADISSTAGPYFNDLRSLARSTATLDFDNDGDMDLVVTHVDHPVTLLENRTERKNHWLSLEIDDPNHRPMEGGRLEIRCPNQEQPLVIPFTAGGSYLADAQKQWTIGLGPDAQGPWSVNVYWPDGTVDHWELVVDRRWRLIPGRCLALSIEGNSGNRSVPENATTP